MTSDDGGGAALTARRGMAMTKTLDENFYGCYLLRSLHPKHPLSTYIGFTNHPRRRIRQHNGEIKNGAKRTKRKRPWQMIAVVCGFTTKVSALQFEWAWQHPRRTRALKGQSTKRGRGYTFQLGVMCTLIRASPWNTFPLEIFIFIDKDEMSPILNRSLESIGHCDVTYGTMDDVYDRYAASPVLDQAPVESTGETSERTETICPICQTSGFEGTKWSRCPHCSIHAHVRCFASKMLGSSSRSSKKLIPKIGTCFACGASIYWSRIVAKACDEESVLRGLENLTITS